MYRDQFGEFVCKYSSLKGWGVVLRTSKKQTELVVSRGLNSRPPDCEFNVLTTRALSKWHLCSHLHCCYMLKSFLFRKWRTRFAEQKHMGISDARSQNWLVTNWSAEQFVATTKSNCWKKLSSLLEILSTSAVTSTIGFSCWARWSEHSARYKKTTNKVTS